MQSRRWGWTHTYAVPMFVTSLVAVVLTGSALVAVLVFDRGAVGTGPTTPSPHASGIDAVATGSSGECLVGSWAMTSERRDVDDASQELTEGTPVTEFRGDGAGSVDYGERTVFEGAVYLVLSCTAEASGNLSFQYEVAEDGLRIQITSNDTELEVDTGLPESDERPDVVGMPEGPYDIAGDADVLTLHSVTEEMDYTAEYQRA